MACDVDPCRLNTLVSIERYAAPASDGQGGQVDRVWAEVEAPWAEVKDMTGYEKDFGQQLEGITKYKMIMRFTDVRLTDRIVWKGKTGNVRNVVDIEERSEYLRIIVEVGVAT